MYLLPLAMMLCYYGRPNSSNYLLQFTIYTLFFVPKSFQNYEFFNFNTGNSNWNSLHIPTLSDESKSEICSEKVGGWWLIDSTWWNSYVFGRLILREKIFSSLSLPNSPLPTSDDLILLFSGTDSMEVCELFGGANQSLKTQQTTTSFNPCTML